MGLGGLVLGSLILYLKGMRIMMFQLSGYYYKPLNPQPLKLSTPEERSPYNPQNPKPYSEPQKVGTYI